jgi:predicted ribonuclease toxin of YeeF-YezG toxin-antitoxin module
MNAFDRSGPQWGEDGNLKPCNEYKTGEYDYNYKTDDQGRIVSVETDDLQITKERKNDDGTVDRLPHNSDTPGKQERDDAGHLIGDRFGGSPDIDNLVSQLWEVNRGEYKKMENEWADAIDRGEKVQEKTEVKYDGDSERPSEINVNYKIGDGDWQERRFPNN